MSDEYKRIAIVTGTTSGIGEATMRKFIAAGFGVVGNGRNAEKLTVLKNEIGSAFCTVVGNGNGCQNTDNRNNNHNLNERKTFSIVSSQFL